MHRVYGKAGFDEVQEAQVLCSHGRPTAREMAAKQEWTLDFVQDAVESFKGKLRDEY